MQAMQAKGVGLFFTDLVGFISTAEWIFTTIGLCISIEISVNE